MSYYAGWNEEASLEGEGSGVVVGEWWYVWHRPSFFFLPGCKKCVCAKMQNHKNAMRKVCALSFSFLHAPSPFLPKSK